MTEHEENVRWVRDIDRMFPCGVVRRNGVVVGAWFTTRYMSTANGRVQRNVALLWRHGNGVGGCHENFTDGKDIATWASDRCGGPSALAGPAAAGFGPALIEAHDLGGVHAALAVRDVPVPWAAAVATTHAATRRAALDGFLSTLDPIAVDLALAHRDQAEKLGMAWPALDRTFSADAPLATLLRRRPGFAGSLLCLGGMHAGIARILLEKPRELDAALADTAKANGVPRNFIPVLAEAERFVTELEHRMGDDVHGEGRVARMRRADRAQRDWPMGLTRRAARFPREWAPSGRAQWEAFVDLCPVLDSGWCVERPELVQLVNSGGDWVAFRARLHAAAGIDAPVDLLLSGGVESAVDDVADMAGAYARDVLVPSCAATWGIPTRHPHAALGWRCSAWTLLNSGRSLPRMLEASRDWHRRRAGMATAKAAMPTAHGDDLTWGAGLPDATAGGVEFKVLTTESGLADEGRDGLNADGSSGLGNCIAGYSEDCLAGHGRIVSLRVPGASPPVRLSVAEIHVVQGRDGVTFAVNEHRGPDNGKAPPNCAAALDGYLRALGSGVLDVDVAALAPSPVAGDDVGQGCRFDWTDAASRAAVRAAWDRLVPAALRDMPEEELSRLACANLRGFEAWSSKAMVTDLPASEASHGTGWEGYEDEAVATMAP